MSPDLLSQYLGNVETVVRKLEDAYVEYYEEEILTANRANLRIRVRYNLVFRYDNTPHFPGLEGFPHHKHLSDKVTGTEEPSILKVIEEAKLLAQ